MADHYGVVNYDSRLDNRRGDDDTTVIDDILDKYFRAYLDDHDDHCPCDYDHGCTIHNDNGRFNDDQASDHHDDADVADAGGERSEDSGVGAAELDAAVHRRSAVPVPAE
jgi:hypothetical protein